jgi:hypothetical protein
MKEAHRLEQVIRGWLFVFLLSPAMVASSTAGEPYHFAAELEVGPVWQSRNEVQIPNDEMGTRFSLVELGGTGPWAAGRLYLSWEKGRHGVRLLLAPLIIHESGVFDGEVDFAGATFQPGILTDATYKFSSWRITYSYRFHTGKRWRWWIGFSAKIRDAEIRLEQGDVVSKDTDVGFVPLLHLRSDWRFAEQWHLILDLDAIGGGPGRAEDLSVKLSRDIGARWRLAAGYRTVEGGADVESVYNFAWLNYAVVSATYRF